jgi:hypothetical protein
VMGLTTRIITVSFVLAALSTFGLRATKRHYPAAVHAACKCAARGHEPVHLQIGSSCEVVEFPYALNLPKYLRTPPQVLLTKKGSIEVGIMVEPSRPSSLLVSKSTLRW